MKTVELNYVVENNSLLLEYLFENIKNKSKNNIKSLLKNESVFVNDKNTTKFDYPLKKGDKIKVLLSKLTNNKSNINILYEDKYIVAVDKPYGLLTIATEKEKDKTLYHYVREYLKYNGGNKVFIVHRLDKDTSGVVIFAKNEKTKMLFQSNWDNLVTLKKYIAVVEGITDKSGTIKSNLTENKEHFVYSSKEGKLAITDYKLLKNNKKFSMLEVVIKTGRKNQIRVHMSDINHPILGDDKYGSKIDPLNRLALHSNEIVFKHPITNKEIKIVSLIPTLFTNMFNV